jgi:hypothetical protein
MIYSFPYVSFTSRVWNCPSCYGYHFVLIQVAFGVESEAYTVAEVDILSQSICCVGCLKITGVSETVCSIVGNRVTFRSVVQSLLWR